MLYDALNDDTLHAVLSQQESGGQRYVRSGNSGSPRATSMVSFTNETTHASCTLIV